MSEIILHLSAGQGPEECRWVVAQLARAFGEEAQSAGLECAPVEPFEGHPATLFLRVSGENADAFAAERIGSIAWVGDSPFRPHHQRRNWFVGVSLVPVASELAALRDEDISYQTMRASGPGGQHVNKTDSAVRATHRPTGFTAFAQDQRSQHANRKMARLKLALMLAEQASEGERDSRRQTWSRNNNLERGNPVRTYVGPKFKRKG